ncbi:MAG: ATP-binding cassette domain-containing protein, partial [Bacillota bacterium]|nr:ATP-binding cassette domain-containing protein [Bacillota bacterium]
MEVRLQEVTMRFGPVTALDRLTLTLAKGKLVGLLGPSGCGKSTTLFLLAGLYQSTEGRIFFGDRDMTRVPPER